jgi:LytS/YehU family sensor histidine kinase
VALAKQDAGKTEEFALKLSKLLRLRLIENSPAKLPLTEEIETIRLYLEIEKERFFDRLDYSVVIPENTEKLLVPTDILLYLVENSIKHGISKQVGKGMIKVEITATGNQIKMSVADNGPDFPENPIYGTGLKSILEKLDILYPDNYEFAIFNHPEKRVEITLNK